MTEWTIEFFRSGLTDPEKDGSGGLRKVYPEHWSFMLREIALYSFVI